MLIGFHVLPERKQQAPLIRHPIEDIYELGRNYFGMYCTNWDCAPVALQNLELAEIGDDSICLSASGAARATELASDHPRYVYVYNEFFQPARHSAALARFCERVYGRNLCSMGWQIYTRLIHWWR
jgi:hypothetical protein